MRTPHGIYRFLLFDMTFLRQMYQQASFTSSARDQPSLLYDPRKTTERHRKALPLWIRSYRGRCVPKRISAVERHE